MKKTSKRKDANSIPTIADAVPTTFQKLTYPVWAQPQPIGLRCIYNPVTKTFFSVTLGYLPAAATAHIKPNVNLYLEGYLTANQVPLTLAEITAKATGGALVGRPNQRLMFYVSDFFGSAKQTQRIQTLWRLQTSYTNYTSKVFTMMIGTVEDALRFRQNWYAGNFPTILFKSPDRLWAQPYSTVSVNSPHPHGRKGK